jgi:hypothetical protein
VVHRQNRPGTVVAVAVLLGLQALLFLVPAILIAAKVWQLGFADTLDLPGIRNYVLREVAPGLLAATVATCAGSGVLSLRPPVRTALLVLEPAFVLLSLLHLGGNRLIIQAAWVVIILLFTPKLKEAFASRGDQPPPLLDAIDRLRS